LLWLPSPRYILLPRSIVLGTDLWVGCTKPENKTYHSCSGNNHSCSGAKGCWMHETIWL
jgi:hypothetical protein